MRAILGATTALLLAALAGCASPYKPNGVAGGFSETRRADDVYVVRFKGNGFTKPEQAEEMVLLRAAELTLEKGFRYFAILAEGARSDSVLMPMPNQSYTTGTVAPYGGFQAQTTSIGVPMAARFPTAQLQIGMANEKADRSFYDARSIVDDLGPKYKK